MTHLFPCFPRRVFLALARTGLAAAGLAVVLGPAAMAQQPDRVYRIGYISNRDKIGYREVTLRAALKDLGYVEGRNLVFEWRFANGKRERLAEFAAELVRLKVDCFVTSGPGSTLAAKRATRTTPVVMANVFDPIQSGIVTNLARPGGNITGFSTMSVGLSGKQLDMLKAALPRLGRVMLLVERAHPNGPPTIAETRAAAAKLGVQVQVVETGSAADFDTAFRRARDEQTDAVVIHATGLMNIHLRRLVRLEAEARVPVMYNEPRFADAGGLLAFGPDRAAPYRDAAAYVDRILKGARPSDLPVQQPSKFDFVVNMKTAKKAGIRLSSEIVYRATRVIE